MSPTSMADKDEKALSFSFSFFASQVWRTMGVIAEFADKDLIYLWVFAFGPKLAKTSHVVPSHW